MNQTDMGVLEFLYRVKEIDASFAEDCGGYFAEKISSLFDDICSYFEDNTAFVRPTLLLTRSLEDDIKSIYVEYSGKDYILLDMKTSYDCLYDIHLLINREWVNMSRINGTGRRDGESEDRGQVIERTLRVFEEYFSLFSVAHEIGHYLVKLGMLDTYSISPRIDCRFTPISRAIRFLVSSDSFDIFFLSSSFHEEVTCDCFALFVLFNYYLFREGEKGFLMPTINQLMTTLSIYNQINVILNKIEEADEGFEAEEELDKECNGLEIRQICLYCISEELIRCYCSALVQYCDMDADSEEASELEDTCVSVFGSTYCHIYKLVSYFLRLDRLHIFELFLDDYEEVFDSSSIEAANSLHAKTPFNRTHYRIEELDDDRVINHIIKNCMKRARFLELIKEEYELSDNSVLHLPLKTIVKDRIGY